MTSRTNDNFRQNFWTWGDPPPPFEQCSKKHHFSPTMASLNWLSSSFISSEECFGGLNDLRTLRPWDLVRITLLLGRKQGHWNKFLLYIIGIKISFDWHCAWACTMLSGFNGNWSFKNKKVYMKNCHRWLDNSGLGVTSDDKSESGKSGQPIMLDLVGNWQLVINNYSKAWSSIKMSPKGRAWRQILVFYN